MEYKLRTAPEIARRTIVLQCVVAASTDVSKQDMMDWLAQEKLTNELTPWERKFMEFGSNSQSDKHRASWRVESQTALLWSIQKLEHLNDMTKQCDTALIYQVIPGLFTPTAPFIESAKCRTWQEISDLYEITYDAHVEIDQAKRNRAETSISYDPGVVWERHYALNWLTCYGDDSWDDIRPDT